MSLITPILQSISAFDKSKIQEFTFFVNSGDQVVANRLVIARNDNNTVVYDQVQTTFQLKHILPINTLVNGIEYKANIYTRNASGQESQVSNTILFKCFTTPTVMFTNLVADQIVNSSNYEFQISYSQSEGEQLESYQFLLYNVNDELEGASIVKRDGLLKHTFSGLKDNSQHKIKAKIQTVNGMTKETESILFTVEYITPTIAAAIYLENLPNLGRVKLSSNIINITATSNPNPPTYINNEEVDLRNDGNYVEFDEGFKITGDFTLRIWVGDLKENEVFLVLYGLNDTDSSKQRIEISYRNGRIYVDKIYGFLTYHVESEIILPTLTSDNTVFVYLQSINNLLNLSAQNLG
jgi:hypothetical protein